MIIKIGDIAKLYNEIFANLDEQLVDEINMNCYGYGGGGSHLIPMCKTVNELLHLLHSHICNNEQILQSMPKLAETKKNSHNRAINLYGVENDLARKIFEEFPLEEDYGTTDILSLDDRILMMVRDRGHALSLEIVPNHENEKTVRYFIPKICNIEMVNKLKGVRKVDKTKINTKGMFDISEDAIVEELFKLISGVPRDIDMPRMSKEEIRDEIRRQIEEEKQREMAESAGIIDGQQNDIFKTAIETTEEYTRTGEISGGADKIKRISKQREEPNSDKLR